MRLIKPSYKILTNIDGEEILKNIERAGRTCYKSENKINLDSAKQFVAMIAKRGHASVIEHEIVSVKIICDRGITHEIVRHRLASYSQESTRYCNYSKDKFGNQITFILPNWFKRLKEGIYETMPIVGDAESVWLIAMRHAETLYFDLILKGWKPQQARSVLPNSLKTEIVMTANLREWQHFFRLRTSNAAHPQMREIACPLLDEFKERIPVIFDDITYDH